MPKNRKPVEKPLHQRMGWPQACRDVVIQSMTKGQLPVLALAAIAFLMVWRMPPEDVTTLAFAIVNKLATWELTGWALCLFLMAGWFYHARWMRKTHADELHRIGSEKSQLQGSAAGVRFPSSRGR